MADTPKSDAIGLLFPPGGLLAGLKEACGAEWTSYVDHDFVRGLGDGTLPERCFRHYLVQDYLFLIHFARAYALAAYKGRYSRTALTTASAILDTEMGLHVAFCTDWGLDEAAMASAPEAPATLAYTRYVLERGWRAIYWICMSRWRPVCWAMPRSGWFWPPIRRPGVREIPIFPGSTCMPAMNISKSPATPPPL
jgi:thiaminase